MISLIVAASKNNVIGEEGTIPWHISEDLIRMKKLTEGHPIIMGRKTHESISGFKNFEGWKHNEKFEHKLLPNRTNIIVTRQTDYEVPGGIVTHSLEEAIQAANKSEGSDEIFIIGGESLFKEGLSIAKRVYLTVIDREVNGDSFFPELESKEWELEKEEKRVIRFEDFELKYFYRNYKRKNLD